MNPIRSHAKIFFVISLCLLFYFIISLNDLGLKIFMPYINENFTNSIYDYESKNDRGIQRRKALYNKYGFDALLSDTIKLTRMVPDVRYKACKFRASLTNLPKSSIIITFYNERRSVLLRTVYSILQRTPFDLIQEIILVDDASTSSDLHGPLYEFLKKNLPTKQSKVRLLRLPRRQGLTVARMTGARNASKSSEVLIFVDSHVEMMYDWLPPLLEPIALNSNASTIPSLDTIDHRNFQYHRNKEFRGYFDWSMNLRIREVNAAEPANSAKNFHAYVMMGGALAISANFFWHLGGFDEGMKLWGGDQFEISFKIWMCGGELISVPCSRMAHLYRKPQTMAYIKISGNYEFLDKNIRRLIDVWLDDEHRQYVLNHRSNVKRIIANNLTERIALRDRLQCQNFSWMLQHIMPDLKQIFPPIEPRNYGQGKIRNVLSPEICIVWDPVTAEKIVLDVCGTKLYSNFWTYTSRCEFLIDNFYCLDARNMNGHVKTNVCNLLGGSQKWFYDIENQWIVNTNTNLCLLADFKNLKVNLTTCNADDLDLKWSLESYNATASNKCGPVQKNEHTLLRTVTVIVFIMLVLFSYLIIKTPCW